MNPLKKHFPFRISPQLVFTLFLLGLLTILIYTYLSIAPLVSFAQSPTLNNPVLKELVGRWEAPGGKLSFIFTPEGKVYYLTENPPGSLVAYPILEKISDNGTLPPNVQIRDIQAEAQNQANRARQVEGRQYIAYMNKAQQAYYIENGKFGRTFEEIGAGVTETENYRYQIVSQGNQTQSVMMTAQAKKPDLKSYTGAVFAIKNNSADTITISGICETDDRSSNPPTMPTLPNNPSARIQCPMGSHLLAS